MVKKDFDLAFAKISEAFPFKGYISEIVYQEMFSIVRALNKCIPVFKGHKLLDIGSGPMDKTAILQVLGFDCSAVDDLSDPWHLFNNNISKIKNFADSLGINFHHQKDGMYEIPFEENTFDVVTSFSVIEHLHESPRGLLNTMGSYLNVGGFLVIVMPNSVNLRKRISVLFGKTNYNPIGELYFSTESYRGHVREYTLSETVFLCEQSGFDVVYANTFEHFAHGKLKSPFRELYLLLGCLIKGFRSGLLVIAQKPQEWLPVEKDEGKYYRSIMNAVPKGVV